MYITKLKITKIQSLTSFTQIRELKLLANLLQKYFYVPLLERIKFNFEMYLRKNNYLHMNSWILVLDPEHKRE